MVKEALLRASVQQRLNPVQRKLVDRLAKDEREAIRAHGRLLTLRGKFGPGHRDDFNGYLEQSEARMADSYSQLKDYCDQLNGGYHA